jgi:hypothetical protein
MAWSAVGRYLCFQYGKYVSTSPYSRLSDNEWLGRRWIELSTRISGLRPTPRWGHSMISVGEKILVLGGEGPGGNDLYEDAVVELDTSKLLFPPERRKSLQAPRIQTRHSRTHSLGEHNTGGMSDPPQVTRATSEHVSAQVRHHGPVQLSDASPTPILPVGTHSDHVVSNEMPQRPTCRESATTPSRAVSTHYIDTTIPPIHKRTRSVEFMPTATIYPASPLHPLYVLEPAVSFTQSDDEDLESFEQKYRFDDGQWPSDYISGSHLDDFELLDFIRQQSASDAAQKLKLVVLEPEEVPHDALTHFARGEGNAAIDGIEYQRFIDGGSNGEVHQVRL